MNLLNMIEEGHRFIWSPTNDRFIELTGVSLTGQIQFTVNFLLMAGDDPLYSDPRNMSSIGVADFLALKKEGAYIPHGSRERPLEIGSNTSSKGSA